MPDRPERLACLIVARQLGDATIHAGFLRSLAARNYADRYLVWTRPHFAFLFADVPACRIVCSQFPVGTTKHFPASAAVGLLRAARSVKREAPSVTLDLLGDFRERLFARIAGSRRHVHIGWDPAHPFAGIIRNPLGSGKPLVRIPASNGSVYAAYASMLDALAPPDPGRRTTSAPTLHDPCRSGRQPIVGLHPFASQECRLWPADNWRQLIHGLLERNARVFLFAAPGERAQLQQLVGHYASQVTLFTRELAALAQQFRRLDLLVGLDSFSIHMAQLQGIRSVGIFGGSPPGLWAPPGCMALASSGGCRSYPCFNVPACERSADRYRCIRSISAGEVLSAVLTQLQGPSKTIPAATAELRVIQ